jgi:hypothetical protein
VAAKAVLFSRNLDIISYQWARSYSAAAARTKSLDALHVNDYRQDDMYKDGVPKLIGMTGHFSKPAATPSSYPDQPRDFTLEKMAGDRVGGDGGQRCIILDTSGQL